MVTMSDSESVNSNGSGDEVEFEFNGAGRRSSLHRGRSSRKLQFRWNEIKDLYLITEIENLKPYLETVRKSKGIWTHIADLVNDRFEAVVDYVGVQRRFSLLLRGYNTKEGRGRYRNGDPEVINQVVEKLGRIASVLEDKAEEEDPISLRNVVEVQKEEEEAVVVNEKKHANLKSRNNASSDEVITKVGKGVGESLLVELWKERQCQDKQTKADREIKLRELKLQEDQLQFEKEKFEHQKLKDEKEFQLREQQLAIDKMDKEAQISSHKLLMEMVLKKL